MGSWLEMEEKEGEGPSIFLSQKKTWPTMITIIALWRKNSVAGNWEKFDLFSPCFSSCARYLGQKGPTFTDGG